MGKNVSGCREEFGVGAGIYAERWVEKRRYYEARNEYESYLMRCTVAVGPNLSACTEKEESVYSHAEPIEELRAPIPNPC